ncbi:hypothetical protein AMATHDRAFT_67038 [Amanita thiersii Skay4041]|uniref:FAD dependent oxidoreductase domain-containing protein n=1 Tax=Amanita thiersii Skay4041 TaxID=703135 RepID=A0A2A9NHI1_9AGAR|nr:hypothetical protein AMATHDRAFT_67038 [Amanita thiersii Skay4041]
MSVASQKREIVVLGAGVVGLTTAVSIQERGGYNVTIVAETFPTDPKSIRYTSHWAGAHHVYNDVQDEFHRGLEKRTFEKLWELSEPDAPTEGLFLRLGQLEHYHEARSENDQLKTMPDYTSLPLDDSFPQGAKVGTTFTSVTIDTPRYLSYLLSRFLAAGGTIIRASIQHVDQLVQGNGTLVSAAAQRTSLGTPRAQRDLPAAVIICAGIGARSLGGVEDTTVYPVRGQTVILRAPWVNRGRTLMEEGRIAYVIPRRSGDVVVGGIRDANDWYPVPRPEITRDILERALRLCPELAPPEIRAERAPVMGDILPLIIEEGCGLRPAREGGIRLEVEWHTRRPDNRRVPVVHNYGHGGTGFQTSWASADKAVELLEDALRQL